jgi:hypothetical protein
MTVMWVLHMLFICSYVIVNAVQIVEVAWCISSHVVTEHIEECFWVSRGHVNGNSGDVIWLCVRWPEVRVTISWPQLPFRPPVIRCVIIQMRTSLLYKGGVYEIVRVVGVAPTRVSQLHAVCFPVGSLQALPWPGCDCGLRARQLDSLSGVGVCSRYLFKWQDSASRYERLKASRSN